MPLASARRVRQLGLPLLVALLAPASFAQVALVEDFEDGDVAYTASAPEFNDGANDFFTRTNGSNISPSYQVTGASGAFYFAAQDLDGDGAEPSQSLRFGGVNVTGLTNLTFSALFAEDDASDGNEDWDDDSSVRVYASLDGGPEALVFAIEADGTNTAPRVDTDLDGTPDGAEITSAFAPYTAAIPGTGSSLDLRIEINNLDAGDEDIAFDDVTVQGSPFGGGFDGATIVVNTSADVEAADGLCSLREAVRAANTNAAVDACAAGTGNDRIGFSPTVGTMAITLSSGELTISDDLLIDGTMPFGNRTVVDGNNASRIFDVAADVNASFAALILRNGNSGAGGSAAPDAGGAVDVKSGGSATFTDTDVTDSVAGVNGGGIHGAGDTDIVITTTAGGSSTIRGNEARGADAGMGGGGVWGAGRTTIRGNVTVSGNRATGTAGSGGGVFNRGGVLVITDATISGNSANRAGGGVEDFGDDDADTDVTLTNVRFLNNTIATAAPGNGGGFHSGGGDTVVDGGRFESNTAVEGGGAWSSGTIAFRGTTFSANVGTGAAAANGGGGFFSQGSTATLTDVVLRGNSATGAAGSGGNVLVNGGAFTMTGGELSGGTSNRAGGGIEVAAGQATLNGVSVTGNNAGASPGNGGGLHAGGNTTVTVNGGLYAQNTAVEGGGLWTADVLTVSGGTVIDRNVATSDNDAAFEGGGGLFNQGGTMTVDGATISNNTATGDGGPGGAGSGGGAFNNGMGTLVVSNSTFSKNSAARAGGGLEVNGGSVTLTSVDFRENATGSAPGNGGALHVSAGTVTATGGTVQSNTAATEGGGFWNNAGFTMTLTDVAFNNNVASGAAADNGGGGLFNNGGDVVVSGASFTGNVASGAAGSGGGLLNNAGTLSVRESSFTGNAAQRAGGAVEDIGGAGSMASFVDVDMTNNDAGDNPGNGGAIHVTGAGTVRVDSSRVTGNTAGGQGGGLWNFGTASMDVSYTSVNDNTAPLGAGLYQQDGDTGLLMFRNSTAAGNAAAVAGGGLLSDGAAVQVVNSTLSGNTAPTGAGAATRGGRVQLSSATVARNVAGARGGGLTNLSPDFGDGDASDDAPADASLLSADNTIVGDNTAPSGADLSGPIMSRGFNLFETTAGATITMDRGASGDITGVDAGLQPLADNGGPTLTHAISLDSPAVNEGMTALAIDQRGAERRQTPDIGAFESDAAPTDGEDAETDFADGETMRMTPAAPNPLTTEARLSVAVRESQTVRVLLYDVMGRQVSVLHDGPMAAATPYPLSVNARGLASGVYVVVVRGESVQGAQRITVAR